MKKQISISRLSFLQKRYKEVLKPVEFGNLLHADPTPTKKYMDWIVVQYLSEHISIDSLCVKRVNAFLSFFNRDKVKNALNMPQRNIHFYKKFADLENLLVPMLGQEEFFSAKELKSKAHVGSFKNYKVYNLTTFEESRILGKNTPWCTSISEDEFDEYTESGKLLLFESCYNEDFRLLYHTATGEFNDQDGKELNRHSFFAANQDIYHCLNKKFSVSVKFMQQSIENDFISYIENHPDMYM